MKKIILSLLLAIPLGMFAQEQKIAVVNTQTVFEAMPEVESVRTEIDKMTKEFESEFQILQDEYNRKSSDYIAQQDSLSENIKALRQQEIQDIQTKTENFVPMARERIGRRQQELVTPIQEKMTKAIQAVGSENGYTYILVNDPQIILYLGTSAIDATDKVKAKLGIK
ncbi:MAG: OmpH family outer membrane protein [Tannerella sp.]|jgi:outer membrane protein|nr:OmpH family outer membrane protein [Tannerella sp.]